MRLGHAQGAFSHGRQREIFGDFGAFCWEGGVRALRIVLELFAQLHLKGEISVQSHKRGSTAREQARRFDRAKGRSQASKKRTNA